jgi:hypothetical protein
LKNFPTDRIKVAGCTLQPHPVVALYRCTTTSTRVDLPEDKENIPANVQVLLNQSEDAELQQNEKMAHVKIRMRGERKWPGKAVRELVD